jgi:flagellar basal-body rod protein FlgC
MNAIEISRTGLDIEWQRLQVIAQNLANINTSTFGGNAFRPMRLVSGPQDNFASFVKTKAGALDPHGVKVLGLTPEAGGTRRVHEPGNPSADAEGYVTYPDVDHAAEMTLLIKTSRAYEANLTAMSIAQQMYTRAAEMGRQA